MNKKGMTIMELIISILLVSIVLIFLFNLLFDATSEYKSGYFAKNNQINRIEVISSFQKALGNNSYNVVIGSFNNYIKLDSHILEYQINDKNYYLLYKENDEIRKKWLLPKGIYIDERGFNCYQSEIINGKYVNTCKLEIYTSDDNDKSGNNNIIDDIVITFTSNA